MENYLNLMIIGATRYDIDDNRVGNEVMKIACDWKHIDQLRNHAERLPAMFTVKAQMKAGQGGKITFKALELKPQEPIKKTA
mgnify:CR=1 FL=1